MRMLALALLILVLSSYPLLSSAQEAERPIVVATTTVIGSVVRDLAGDLVDVRVIASPAICPAHYDIRPSDVEAVARAEVIFYHGFEPWIERLVEAAASKAVMVKISGPWNTPKGLKLYYEEVAKSLERHLGLNLKSRLERCLKAIDIVSQQLLEASREHNFDEVAVVCMQWQKPFLEYLGFRIIATYPPPEKLSARQIKELISTIRKEGAALIIDNLQSGTSVGETLAEETGAIHVVLSNFPGVVPEANNVTSLYKHNLRRLIVAVTIYRRAAKLLSNYNALKQQVMMYEVATYSLAAVALSELAVLLYIRRRR